MVADDKRPSLLGDLLGDLDPGLAKALDGLGKGVLRNAEVHSKPSASSGDALARNEAGRQATEGEQGRAPTRGPQEKTITRALPPGDGQQDMFTPWVRDIASKDSRSIMDVAVFRLSKRDKRANEVIRYDMPDGYVEVSRGLSQAVP